MDVYLANYGTEWQTVPCPICRKRVSYHIILQDVIRQCEMSEIDEIVHRDNLLTRCGYYGSLLHVAAAEGRVEIVKLLIKKGLPVDNLNEFGLSPVYYAATNGKLATLKYFVENHRVDIHIENIFGKTMLDMALEKNHNDTVQYLQEINVKTGSQQGSLSFLEDSEFRARAFSMLCKSILPI